MGHKVEQTGFLFYISNVNFDFAGLLEKVIFFSYSEVCCFWDWNMPFHIWVGSQKKESFHTPPTLKMETPN